MSFPCTRCGLCCQHIANIPQLANYHNGDGICKYYDAPRGCTIYDRRPDICRIDEGYAKFFSAAMTLSEYYAANAAVCNRMQERSELDHRFRVSV